MISVWEAATVVQEETQALVLEAVAHLVKELASEPEEGVLKVLVQVASKAVRFSMMVMELGMALEEQKVKFGEVFLQPEKVEAL